MVAIKQVLGGIEGDLEVVRDRTNTATKAKSGNKGGEGDERDETPKPIAGKTTMKIENPTDPAVDSIGRRLAGWRAVPSETFRVRSQGYLTSREKIPSPGELYDLVAVDIFESGARIPDLSKRVQLPKPDFKDGGEKLWKSPDTFVVSFALPTEAPSMLWATDDGQGYTVTFYYTMKKETRKILRQMTTPGCSADDESTDGQEDIRNGVALWEWWCKTAPTDPAEQARFKVIANAHNLAELGVPSWIASWNAKPFLIKRAGVTGFLYDHPELDAMEFGISFHSFPYLFKSGASYMKEHYFKLVLVSFGFCIEGRDDSELPEVVIGDGMQLCYPDPAIAIQAEEMFGKNYMDRI